MISIRISKPSQATRTMHNPFSVERPQNKCTNPTRADDGVKTCTYCAEPKEGK